MVKALGKSSYFKTQMSVKRIDLSDKEDVDRVYVFKLSDDKVFSSPAGVWVEKSTEGIRPRYIGAAEVYYLIKDMGAKTRKWIGQNVFGARVGVETTKEEQYFVSPIRGTHNIGKLAVKPEGGKIGVLFIGKPAEHSKGDGYISFCGQSYSATFDMPYATVRDFYRVRLDLQEVWVYDQNSGKVLLKQKVSDILAGQRIKYGIKIDELHSKMQSELSRLIQLVQSDPKNAVAVSRGPMSNVEKLIKERDNLKFEALKYYHRNLPPDLAKKFEESERRTDSVRKTMRDAGAQW